MKKLSILTRVIFRLKTGRWPPKWATYYTRDRYSGGRMFFEEKQSPDTRTITFESCGVPYAALFQWGGHKNYTVYNMKTGLKEEGGCLAEIKNTLDKFIDVSMGVAKNEPAIINEGNVCSDCNGEGEVLDELGTMQYNTIYYNCPVTSMNEQYKLCIKCGGTGKLFF